MINQGFATPHGDLSIKVNRCPKAPLSWRLKNALRWGYIWGWLTTEMAHGFSKLTGIATITTQLSARVRRANGQWEDYGVLGRRCLTTTGAGFIVDAWQNTLELELMRYHGCGTGAGAEAAAETALVTECTTTLNPDNVRATGTLAEGVNPNIFSSVGTVLFDGAALVIEHSLFSQAATGGGVMLDRTLFGVLTMAAGDSITFTYQFTITTGG